MAKPSNIKPDSSLAYEQLSEVFLAALEQGKPSQMDRAITWQDGIAVLVDIPGILRFEVLDTEFAKRAQGYPQVPAQENRREWEQWFREKIESQRRRNSPPMARAV